MMLSLLDFLEVFSSIGQSVVAIINSNLSSGMAPAGSCSSATFTQETWSESQWQSDSKHFVAQSQLLACDFVDYVILSLLNLTAAFDAVDHQI